jgi:hypothetical protein
MGSKASKKEEPEEDEKELKKKQFSRFGYKYADRRVPYRSEKLEMSAVFYCSPNS